MTIIRISQHQTGIEDYLETGKKRNRELHRDELDVRVPILGSLDILKKSNDYVNKHKQWNDSYWHITIAMPWKYHLMSDSVNRAITLDVINFYFHLYDIKQLAVYAEIHKPIQQQTIDLKTIEKKQRLPHIHLIISKLDLWSDNQLRILPYLKNVAQAFQIWLDDKYEMESHYQNRGEGGTPLLTVSEAETAIENYQTWHRFYNAPQPKKQKYALSQFMKQQNWKQYANPDQNRLKQLRQTSGQLMEHNWQPYQQDNYFLQTPYTAIQSLKHRLIDIRTAIENKGVIKKINQQIKMRAVLVRAEKKFGLNRQDYEVEKTNKEEWAIDKRTNERFTVVELAHQELNMTLFEAMTWLTETSPDLKWIQEFNKQAKPELLTENLFDRVASYLQVRLG